jgi:hypothetical protein
MDTIIVLTALYILLIALIYAPKCPNQTAPDYVDYFAPGDSYRNITPDPKKVRIGVTIQKEYPLTLIERNFGVPFGRLGSNSERKDSYPKSATPKFFPKVFSNYGTYQTGDNDIADNSIKNSLIKNVYIFSK